MTHEDHIKYLKRCIEVSKEARAAGNTPFGALLVGPDGEILMEQQNIEITTKKCTGHAECTLADRASQEYSRISCGSVRCTRPQSPVQCVRVLFTGQTSAASYTV